jgi:hypothetical protein
VDCFLTYSKLHYCRHVVQMHHASVLNEGAWFFSCTILICTSLFGSHLFLMLSDSWYLEVGESIVDSLNLYTKVEGGYASIRDVTTMELEDHQHSFFLAETYELFLFLFLFSFCHQI